MWSHRNATGRLGLLLLLLLAAEAAAAAEEEDDDEEVEVEGRAAPGCS